MMRRLRLGVPRAATTALLGTGLLLGASVTHHPGAADVGMRPVADDLPYRIEDAKKVSIDRLERDGGEHPRVGSTFHVRAGFAYQGEKTLRQARIAVTLSEQLSFRQEYGNCEYGTLARDPEIRTKHVAVCLVDTEIEPGESVDLPPLAVQVDEFALSENVFVEGWTPMAWSADRWRDRHRGQGGELSLLKRTDSAPPAAARPGRGWSDGVDVPVENTWDLQVTGATLKGGKGDTVTAGLAMDFHGADVGAQSSVENDDPFARVEVRLPGGVSVVRAPEDCRNTRGKPRLYVCDYGLKTDGFDEPVLRDGFHKPFPFELRIDDPSRLTGGNVRIAASASVLRADSDHGNSTAPITFERNDRWTRMAWAAAAGAGALALAGLLAALLVRARRRAR
ncbi:hypothetical protein [Streptomyces sp. NPDC046860]|uniref:hypothetical protein n=1 Tax=Streptomyces sp. NPDC046860 TaxID=3154495 RepID=UPI0033ECB2EA